MVLFTKSLEDLYEWAKTDHPSFWESFTKYVEWFRKWHETFSWDLENYRFSWFAGGRTNLCYNCLDRHVRDGRAGKPAIVWWYEGQGRDASLLTANCTDRSARWPGC